MPNMSYCRFENTYNDLIDCLDNINDEAGNERDERYRIRLIKLIADNMDLISDLKDIEPEYQQSQLTMYIHGIKINDMKIKNLKKYVTELSNDFTEDYLTTAKLKKQFINQVVDYGDGCCETEQELLCYVDGLLTTFK